MYAGFYLVTVFLCSVCLANGAVKKEEEEKEKEYIPIKYPGPINDISSRYGNDNVPDECKDKNYCTIKPPDYPQKKIDAMIKDRNLFSVPELVIETFGDRAGDPEWQDDCETKVTFEPLFKVRNKRGEWRDVIQSTEKNYVQKVRLETCKEVQSPCFKYLNAMNDVEAKCQQTYSNWEFEVLKGDNETERVSTELPVCCSCAYRIKFKK